MLETLRTTNGASTKTGGGFAALSVAWSVYLARHWVVVKTVRWSDQFARLKSAG